MSFMKRFILFGTIFLMIATTTNGVLWADGISPAQEQEFIDAKGALDAARNVQAEKYAPSHMTQAEVYLQQAQNARQIPDATGFSRASILARAYAELAAALAGLEIDVEKLSKNQEAIQKVKAEIEQMKGKP